MIAWAAGTLGSFHRSAIERVGQAHCGQEPQGAETHTIGTGSSVERQGRPRHGSFNLRPRLANAEASFQVQMSLNVTDLPTKASSRSYALALQGKTRRAESVCQVEVVRAGPRSRQPFDGTFAISTKIISGECAIGCPILVYSKVADFWTGMLQASCSSSNHCPLCLQSVISAHLDHRLCSYAGRSTQEPRLGVYVLAHSLDFCYQL